MTAVPASSAVPSIAARGIGLRGVLVAGATALTLLAIAILPLLTPAYIHPAMDAASSEIWLGTDRETAHSLSDKTVQELVLGPGTFAITWPQGGELYTEAEASHLRDARSLLYAFLGVGAVSAVIVVLALFVGRDRRAVWRAIARGGGVLAIAVVVLGVVGWFAFEPAFEMFHRVFFPGGNWAFDPIHDHLVQLYPYAFWQVTAAALGVLAAGLGLVTWVLGSYLGRPRPDAPEAPRP